MRLPQLTEARAPLTEAVDAVDEFGQPRAIHIPAERDLTIYVDKRELVTLMTLGARPEWLTLGYLLNQRLIASVEDVESVAFLAGSDDLLAVPEGLNAPVFSMAFE